MAKGKGRHGHEGRHGGHHDDGLHDVGDDSAELSGRSGDDSGRNGADDKGGRGGTDDSLRGGGDDDRLSGNSGNDDIRGGAGDDRLSGGDDDDSIAGGSGDDKLFGGADDDALSGGRGKDVLNGGSGDDALTGGAGADRFVFRGDDFDIDHILDFSHEQGDRIVLNGVVRDDNGVDGTGGRISSFADLDTNDDGILNDGDAHISLVGNDLHIDIDGPDATLIIGGVESLVASDFIFL